jgi:hypothetical protein
MKLRNPLKATFIAFSLPLLLLLDVAPDAPLGLTLAREAAAIVGRPATPLSYAGVARRTTVRVATTTTAVAATSAAAASTAAAASSAAAASTAQQQQAVAQQQAATAQQQQAVAQQQAAIAQQQAQVAGSPALGTVVPALPGGCATISKGGVQYYVCGNVFYRAAFQGNNLVYVVAQP